MSPRLLAIGCFVIQLLVAADAEAHSQSRALKALQKTKAYLLGTQAIDVYDPSAYAPATPQRRPERR